MGCVGGVECRLADMMLSIVALVGQGGGGPRVIDGKDFSSYSPILAPAFCRGNPHHGGGSGSRSPLALSLAAPAAM